jgi:hypothetical protein
MKAMMKSTLIAGVAVSLMSTAALADSPADGVRFIGDTQFASFCKAVVKDDIRLLRSSVARSVGVIGVSQRDVLRLVTTDNGVTCNGISLIDFSKQRHANSVYHYIETRI